MSSSDPLQQLARCVESIIISPLPSASSFVIRMKIDTTALSRRQGDSDPLHTLAMALKKKMGVEASSGHEFDDARKEIPRINLIVPQHKLTQVAGAILGPWQEKQRGGLDTVIGQ